MVLSNSFQSETDRLENLCCYFPITAC